MMATFSRSAKHRERMRHLSKGSHLGLPPAERFVAYKSSPANFLSSFLSSSRRIVLAT